MYNKIILIGNIGREPDLSYLESGMPVLKFSLAVNHRSRKKDTDEFVDETEWFNITVWGKMAEFNSERLVKGERIYVEGRLRTNQYTSNTGEQRISLEVNADRILRLPRTAASSQAGATRETTDDSLIINEPADGPSEEMPW